MTAPTQQRKNAEQWKLLRVSVDKILGRFERDQEELVTRAKAARADGYPTGSDGGHGSDVTDSTLAAVLSREKAEEGNPAVRALKTFNAALDMLETADRHRSGAFPPAPKVEEPIGWCASCLRINWHSPIDDSKRFAQPNPNCSWCAAWLREKRFLPPVWMLRKRARGERITTMDESRAIAEWAENAQSVAS